MDINRSSPAALSSLARRIAPSKRAAIGITCSDAMGNTSTRNVVVTVPKSQGKQQ